MTSKPQASAPSPRYAYIWVLMGPSGCGKTTVAKYLSRELGLAYIEGDDLHPQSNITKMAAGVPLSDADRWPWLTAVRDEAAAAAAKVDDDGGGGGGCVVTCSCLKRGYRDVLRAAAAAASPELERKEGGREGVRVVFVYLKAEEEVIVKRVERRGGGHYMKAGMVHSQFVVLEEPGGEEVGDVLVVEVGGVGVRDVGREVLGRVKGWMRVRMSAG